MIRPIYNEIPSIVLVEFVALSFEKQWIKAVWTKTHSGQFVSDDLIHADDGKVARGCSKLGEKSERNIKQKIKEPKY